MIKLVTTISSWEYPPVMDRFIRHLHTEARDRQIHLIPRVDSLVQFISQPVAVSFSLDEGIFT